jgi:hypothetical protein
MPLVTTSVKKISIIFIKDFFLELSYSICGQNHIEQSSEKPNDYRLFSQNKIRRRSLVNKNVLPYLAVEAEGPRAGR